MDDALLAARAAAGDLDAFGQLYDGYVDPVYDLAWRTLRNGDAAAAAVREIFGRAAAGLASRERQAFGPWLFTIAHQAVLARATAPRADDETVYEEAFGSFDVPDPARLEPSANVDPELGSLAWDAARDLTPRDYALLDLHLRKGLTPADLQGVLGASARDATAVVSRMRRAASGVFGGYMVARRARNCEALRHLLADFVFPPYSDPVRTAVDAHIVGCDACKAELAAMGDPLAPFSALATIPAPLDLKGDAWRDLSALWPPEGAADAFDAGSFGVVTADGDDGAGGRSGVLMAAEGDGGNRMLLFAVAVAGMVVFAFAVAAGVLIAGGLGDDGGAAAEATATPTVTQEAPTEEPVSTHTAGVSVETSTPEPATDTPVPTDTPTLEPETPTPEVTDTPVPTAEGTEEPGTTPEGPTPATGTDTPTP